VGSGFSRIGRNSRGARRVECEQLGAEHRDAQPTRIGARRLSAVEALHRHKRGAGGNGDDGVV